MPTRTHAAVWTPWPLLSRPNRTDTGRNVSQDRVPAPDETPARTRPDSVVEQPAGADADHRGAQSREELGGDDEQQAVTERRNDGREDEGGAKPGGGGRSVESGPGGEPAAQADSRDECCPVRPVQASGCMQRHQPQRTKFENHCADDGRERGEQHDRPHGPVGGHHADRGEAC